MSYVKVEESYNNFLMFYRNTLFWSIPSQNQVSYSAFILTKYNNKVNQKVLFFVRQWSESWFSFIHFILEIKTTVLCLQSQSKVNIQYCRCLYFSTHSVTDWWQFQFQFVLTFIVQFIDLVSLISWLFPPFNNWDFNLVCSVYVWVTTRLIFKY